MNDEVTQFSGHPVIDRHGEEVGTITDVVYDEVSEKPTWGVVSPGWSPRPALHPLDASGLSRHWRRGRRAVRQVGRHAGTEGSSQPCRDALVASRAGASLRACRLTVADRDRIAARAHADNNGRRCTGRT